MRKNINFQRGRNLWVSRNFPTRRFCLHSTSLNLLPPFAPNPSLKFYVKPQKQKTDKIHKHLESFLRKTFWKVLKFYGFGLWVVCEQLEGKLCSEWRGKKGSQAETEVRREKVCDTTRGNVRSKTNQYLCARLFIAQGIHNKLPF
jgi:hypothetical protein